MKRPLIIGSVIVSTFCLFGFSFFGGKKEPIDPKPFTLEQLSQFDGKDGWLMYVAIEGQVYDITKCNKWKEGIHEPSFGKAIAGKDLTEVLKETPHGMKNLKRYPVVGFIVDE